MIYLDSSVALAWLFTEDRAPSPDLWRSPLVSSRLLEYETLTRVNARGGELLPDAARLLARVAFAELAPPILARAREPFPVPVRTLDALHVATAWFLEQHGQPVRVATYDARLAAVCTAVGIDSFAP